MYRNEKYNGTFKNLWGNDGDSSTLKRENYNLTAELSKVKKCNALLVKEKKELESRLVRSEHLLQNIQMFNSHRMTPQFPEEIELILNKVETTVRNELYSKIENLISCLTCVVCNEQIKSVVYSECRHLVTCIKCNENLGNECPLCRQLSRKVIIYH